MKTLPVCGRPPLARSVLRQDVAYQTLLPLISVFYSAASIQASTLQRHSIILRDPAIDFGLRCI